MEPMPRTPAPEVVAGRYELGGLLGRGGMGEVREGVDTRLGRLVAIKFLRADLAAEPELRQRFEAEARAAAGLSHPNVVAVYDTGDHDGVPYIVMERLGGRTLADEIEAGPLEPRRAQTVARQTLAALDAAHRAGIVHRDIKPANLLVASDSSVKVADFGIAKAAEGLGADVTVTGEVLGTPAYLAPERLEGRPATARSDLFSLGVVLYEALSGTKPFSAPTPWGVAQAIISGEHRRLDQAVPGLAPGLVETVERAMAGDPEDRFATAAEMARSLDDATVAVASPTRGVTERMPAPPTAGPTVEHPLRRPQARPRLVTLAVAAAAVVLVIAVALMARDPGTGDVGPTTSTSTARTGLPEPLDRALDDLEEAVRP